MVKQKVSVVKRARRSVKPKAQKEHKEANAVLAKVKQEVLRQNQSLKDENAIAEELYKKESDKQSEATKPAGQ
jgi:hypothetical protein